MCAVGDPDVKNFSWEKYLSETGSLPAPARAFKSVSVVILHLVMPETVVTCVPLAPQRPPHAFQLNMKLEAVDRRNPVLIRVATVVDTDDHRLRVRITCLFWWKLCVCVICVVYDASANLTQSLIWRAIRASTAHASHDLCVLDLCRRSVGFQSQNTEQKISSCPTVLWILTAGLESVCQLVYRDHRMCCHVQTLLFFYSVQI